jgi:hypothetical protein
MSRRIETGKITVERYSSRPTSGGQSTGIVEGQLVGGM